MMVIVRPPEGATADQTRDAAICVCAMVEIAGHGVCRPPVRVWPVAEQRTLFV